MRLLLRLGVMCARWLWAATLVAIVAITVFAVGLMTRLDNSTDMANAVADTMSHQVALVGDGSTLPSATQRALVLAEAEANLHRIEPDLASLTSGDRAAQLVATMIRGLETVAADAERVARGEADVGAVAFSSAAVSTQLDGLLQVIVQESDAATATLRLVLIAAVVTLVVGGAVSALGFGWARSRQDQDRHASVAGRMSYLAYHDALTDLPNRLQLVERLTHALAEAPQLRRKVAVIFLDLDRFKQINDTLGHAVGDLFLQAVAGRLTRLVGPGNLVARLGGDEFALLLPNLTTGYDASIVAEQVVNVFRNPVSIAGREFTITPSVGVALYPEHGMDAEALLHSADTAMYTVKEAGGNQWRGFSANLAKQMAVEAEMERDLRQAIEQGNFLLEYQPMVDLTTREVVSAEALVRMRHPSRGVVQPAEFIALAEETGLIVPLGEWAIREACTQTRRWLEAGVPVTPTAVNISPLHFRDSGLLPFISAVLAETGVPPSLLRLEITEHTAMQDVDFTIGLLEELRRRGIGVAIDDFGSGYSSLSYLRRLPVDTIKLDRAFVSDIATTPSDAEIVTVLVSLARALGLNVVAEGVETERQAALLTRLGCPQAQGYLFGRPLAGQAFGRMLKSRAAPAA